MSFIFLFASCAVKVKDSQLYGKCRIPMYGCTQIMLNENNTFEIYTFTDVGGGENLTKGTWKIHSGDTIVLNSYKRPSQNEIEDEKIFSYYLNPELVVNLFIVLKKNRILYLTKNKNLKAIELKKVKLTQRMWKEKPNT